MTMGMVRIKVEIVGRKEEVAILVALFKSEHSTIVKFVHHDGTKCPGQVALPLWPFQKIWLLLAVAAELVVYMMASTLGFGATTRWHLPANYWYGTN
jgi:hypothetical protein